MKQIKACRRSKNLSSLFLFIILMKKKGVAVMIQIISKNLTLTDAIRNYVEKKLSKSNDYIKNEKIYVYLKKINTGYTIEIVTNFNGSTLTIKEQNEDLFTGIDKIQDRFIEALRRRKEKIKSKKSMTKNAGKKMAINDIIDDNLIEEEYHHPKIVKRKLFDMKPMNVEEAILQMEALGHNSFMFLNSETDTMCLLYRRKDGNYGYIEGNR